MHYEKIREFATLYPGMYQRSRGDGQASFDSGRVLPADREEPETVRIEKREKIIYICTMVGFKHIPQTITGKQAEKILKAIPQNGRSQEKKSLTPLPDQFTIKK